MLNTPKYVHIQQIIIINIIYINMNLKIQIFSRWLETNKETLSYVCRRPSCSWAPHTVGSIWAHTAHSYSPWCCRGSSGTRHPRSSGHRCQYSDPVCPPPHCTHIHWHGRSIHRLKLYNNIHDFLLNLLWIHHVKSFRENSGSILTNACVACET